MTGHPPTARLAHEPENDESGEPIILRLGFIVAGGVLSALVSALPAALRMGEGGSVARALEQWIVLAAVATPLAVVGVAVMRRARVGLRLLMGDRAELLALGVLWWSVLEVALLSIFGAVLRKTTHQHALAGVTFSMFAVMSGVVLALFARKTTMMLADATPTMRKAALGIGAACAFLGLTIVGVRLSRAEGMHTAAGLVDSLAFAVATAIASSRLLVRWRPVAIAGVPLAVLVIMVGLTTLRFEPGLSKALAETAPMHSLVIALFGS